MNAAEGWTDRLSFGRRPISIVIAVMTTVALYLAATTAGVDLVVPQTLDLNATQTMPLGVVIAVATLAGLGGWGAAILLEKYTRLARDLWIFAAFLVVLASIVPIFLMGQVGADFFWQISLHLVLAAILVAGFWPTFEPVAESRLPEVESDGSVEEPAGDDSEE